MNFTGPMNAICGRPIAPPVNPPVVERRRIDGIEEGDSILVQSSSGVCDQGVFIRLENGFLVWVRTLGTTAHIAVTSLDGINITKL